MLVGTFVVIAFLFPYPKPFDTYCHVLCYCLTVSWLVDLDGDSNSRRLVTFLKEENGLTNLAVDGIFLEYGT